MLSISLLNQIRSSEIEAIARRFPAGARVLEIGAGTGQQALELRKRGFDVEAIDVPSSNYKGDQLFPITEYDGRKIPFPDASFDVVFHPVANVFCPDLQPVWDEAFRVLRPGGLLLAGFMNPDIFIFDVGALDRDEFVVRHPLPFSTLDLPDAERRQHYGDGPIEYSHSLTSQLGGQMAAGFCLTHLAEAPHHADATRRYMPGYIATRAIKPDGPL